MSTIHIPLQSLIYFAKDHDLDISSELQSKDLNQKSDIKVVLDKLGDKIIQKKKEVNVFYHDCINHLINKKNISEILSTISTEIQPQTVDGMAELQKIISEQSSRIEQQEQRIKQISIKVGWLEQSKEKQEQKNRSLLQQKMQLQRVILRLQKQIKEYKDKCQRIVNQIYSFTNISVSQQVTNESYQNSIRVVNISLQNLLRDLSFYSSSSLSDSDETKNGQFHLFGSYRCGLNQKLVKFIQDTKERKIQSAIKLYSYPQDKNHNFHDFIDMKQNILLVCQSSNDIYIGAFTEASFSQRHQQKNTKAFLFGAFQGKISYNILKKGKASIQFDRQFLIFGSDQLSIAFNTNQLASSFNKIQKDRHYLPSIDEDYVAKIFQNKKNIQLEKYFIYQIEFSHYQ